MSDTESDIEDIPHDELVKKLKVPEFDDSPTSSGGEMFFGNICIYWTLHGVHCKYHIYLHIYISHIHVLGEEDDESSEPERDPKRGAGRRSGTPSEKQPASGEKTPVDTDAEQRY